MKITCTEYEKEWLMKLMIDSDRCPIRGDCESNCYDCFIKNVEWTIDDGEKLLYEDNA